MGYDLHITRAEFWAENEGQEISAEEWLALVESDRTLTINVQNGPHFAELVSPNHDFQRWLNWNEGNILSKNPDRVTLEKMLQVASRLEASVQGDDGERYVNIDDYSEPVSSRSSGNRQPESTTTYLKREIMWNWVMYALVILAVLAVNLLDLW